MAKMYVANCTNQVQDFHYRVPENNRVIKQQIAIGEQIQLSGDLSTPAIESIIEQHGPYGMVAVSEIDRTKPFIGVCYSLDKPVDIRRVLYAVKHNLEVLDERGRVIRQEAAVAVSNSIQSEGNPLALQALEMSIEEQPVKGQEATVNEVTKVTRREGPTHRAPPAQARSAAKAIRSRA